MKQKMVKKVECFGPKAAYAFGDYFMKQKMVKKVECFGPKTAYALRDDSMKQKMVQKVECFGPKAAHALGGVCGQTEAVLQVDAATTVPFEQYPCPSSIHSTTSSVSRTFAILLMIGSSMRQILNKKNRTVMKPCCLKKHRMK